MLSMKEMALRSRELPHKTAIRLRVFYVCQTIVALELLLYQKHRDSMFLLLNNPESEQANDNQVRCNKIV